MSLPDDDLDALRRLAADRRQGVDGSARLTPRPASTAKQAAVDENIASVLAGRASAPPAKPTGRAEVAAGKVSGAGESLEQLLRMGSAAPPRAPVSSTESAAEFERVEDLVHRGSPASPRRAAQPVAETQHTVRAVSVDFRREESDDVAQPATDVGPPSRFHPPLRHAIIAALLLLSAAWAIYHYQPGQKTYPTPLAAQVAQLAAAVDAHYDKHRSLPKTLTQLEEFPADALQWPIENYGLRMMERRTEFFFGGVSGFNYFVIGRVGEEAWIFTKGEKPELQQVPAH